MSTGEPAQSPAERVTEKKENDPKRVAVGRAGAAARKAKQTRLLEQLHAAKESLRPPVSTADNCPFRRNRSADSGPGAVCLAGGGESFVYVFLGGNMRLRASPTSEAAGPALKVQDKPIEGLPRPPQYAIRPCQPRLPTVRCSLTRYTTARSSLSLLWDAPGSARWRLGVTPRSLTFHPEMWAWSWSTSLSPCLPRTC